MTTIIIPYEENKDKSILILLNYFASEFFDIPSNRRLEYVKDKLDTFREGKDIHFDISSKDLPGVLRSISDDGFVYKPDYLKKFQSDHLITMHNCQIIVHQNCTAEIHVFLNETKNGGSVTVSANTLTQDEKLILTSAITEEIKTLPKKTTSWEIEVKKISFTISPTNEMLQYVGQQWTQRQFKA